jgi:glycosyltransferase involved in cell wall biosynthesis
VGDHEWAAINQLVPSLLPHDAIGTHVTGLRDGLRARGVASEIYSLASVPATAALVRPVAELLGGPPRWNTLLTYHLASGSVLADDLAARQEPLAVVSHNVTPPHLMAPWAPEVARELLWAHRQLLDLAPRALVGIGVSEFNAADLRRAGYRRVAVAPLVLDTRRWPAGSSPVGSGESPGSDPEVLFVGRVAPNKAHLELVAAIALLRRTSLPGVRLRLVGSLEAVPSYVAAVRGLIADLGLTGVVTLTGGLDDAALADAYRGAAAFCCLSVHEGVGVPLLEAMHAGVPVVALGEAAIPETVGPAGLLIPDSSPTTVATALRRVLTDADLRRRLIAAGRRRVAELTAADPVDAFLTAVTEDAPT